MTKQPSLILPSSRPYQPPERRQVLLWAGVMIAGLVVMVLNFQKYQVGAHYDDAAYITLARSILHGDYYGLINFPGHPRTWNYPFGYPLLLAPFALIQSIFQDSLNVFKVLSIISTMVNASLLFWGWRQLTRGLSYWWGLGIMSLYLFSPVTIDLSGRVMSEPIFMTFYLIGMLLVERIVAKKARLWEVFILSIALTFIIYIRTIGIVFLISLLIYLWLAMGRRSLRPILISLLGIVFCTILIVSITPVQTSDLFPTKYLSDQQAELIVKFFDTVTPQAEISGQEAPSTATPPSPENGSSGSVFYNYIILGIPQRFGIDLRAAIIPLGGSDREAALFNRLGIPYLSLIIGFLISGFVLLGYVRWFSNEKITAFNSSSVVYFLSLFLWVWDESRFLSPIQPQLFTAFLLGIQFMLLLLQKTWIKIHRPAITRPLSRWLVVIVAALLLLSLIKSVRLADSYQHAGDLSNRTQWIKDNTPANASILSEYPVLDFIYSNRLTIDYPSSDSTEKQFIRYLEINQVDYILIAPRLFWRQPVYKPSYSQDITTFLPTFDNLLQKNRLTLVYTSAQEWIAVYRVLK